MTEPEKIKYDLMCCLVLGGSESVAIIVRDEDDEYLRIGWINSQRE